MKFTNQTKWAQASEIFKLQEYDRDCGLFLTEDRCLGFAIEIGHGFMRMTENLSVDFADMFNAIYEYDAFWQVISLTCPNILPKIQAVESWSKNDYSNLVARKMVNFIHEEMFNRAVDFRQKPYKHRITQFNNNDRKLILTFKYSIDIHLKTTKKIMREAGFKKKEKSMLKRIEEVVEYKEEVISRLSKMKYSPREVDDNRLVEIMRPFLNMRPEADWVKEQKTGSEQDKRLLLPNRFFDQGTAIFRTDTAYKESEFCENPEEYKSGSAKSCAVIANGKENRYVTVSQIKQRPEFPGLHLAHALTGDVWKGTNTEFSRPNIVVTSGYFYANEPIEVAIPIVNKKALLSVPKKERVLMFKRLHNKMYDMFRGKKKKENEKNKEAKDSKSLLIELTKNNNKMIAINTTFIQFCRDAEDAKEAEEGLETYLKERAREDGEAAQGAENIIEIETDPAGQIDHFANAMPFGCARSHVSKTPYWSTCSTLNAGCFLPICGDWTGIAPQGGAKPVWLTHSRTGQIQMVDSHTGDLNSNGMCVAPTGTGKSVALNMMALTSASAGRRVYIFEEGKSTRKLVSLLNGQYIDFGAGNMPDFTPFLMLSEYDPDSYTKKQIEQGEDKKDWADYIEMISTIYVEMCTPENSKLTEGSAEVVREIVNELAKDPAKGANARNEDVLAAILSHEDGDINKLARSLKMYCKWEGKEGAYYYAFNSKNAVDFKSDLIAIDIERFANNKALASIILMTVSVKILADIMSQKHTQREKLVLLDEFFRLITGAAGGQEQMQRFTEQLFRQIRKKGGSCWVFTQTIADLDNTPKLKKSVINNTKKFFILKTNNVSLQDFEQSGIFGRRSNDPARPNYTDAVLDLLGKLDMRKPEETRDNTGKKEKDGYSEILMSYNETEELGIARFRVPELILNFFRSDNEINKELQRLEETYGSPQAAAIAYMKIRSKENAYKARGHNARLGNDKVSVSDEMKLIKEIEEALGINVDIEGDEEQKLDFALKKMLHSVKVEIPSDLREVIKERILEHRIQ